MLDRAETGIDGLDRITGGGLPRGRTTIVVGSPGTGKTVLALQAIEHGSRQGQPAIYVTFEEDPARSLANIGAFTWASESTPLGGRIKLIDARPDPDLVFSGDADLSGLIAMLQSAAQNGSPGWVVLDGIDALLGLLPDATVARRELYRLHRWLADSEITAIITVKDDRDNGRSEVAFMEYLADCVVLLRRDMTEGTLQRSACVIKYRGSGFDENEAPMLIGSRGIEIAGVPSQRAWVPGSVERVSSGVVALDDMLDGGFLRGSSILLTGSPGTAKTTLAGAFAAAAAARAEPTLFISFDSPGPEIVRNLESVGIDLAGPVERGLLLVESARSTYTSAEQHLLRIIAEATQFSARNIVVDPVSAFAKPGNAGRSASVAERLVDWAKGAGATLLMTSLVERETVERVEMPINISTIADAWIHLENVTHAGERNRGLTIVKARGVSHSNQVRELVLTDQGPTLTDVYRSGGAVLMGTARWEREQQDKLIGERERDAVLTRRLEIDLESAQIDREVGVLETRRLGLVTQLEQLDRDLKGSEAARQEYATRIAERRTGATT